MIKVYAQQKPQIVMEGSKGLAYFSGELEASISNGLVNIMRSIHGDDVVEFERPHTDFTDSNGDSFGTLEETIDALNDIFNTQATRNESIQIGGRFYLYADLRWITFNVTYGINTENQSTSGGVGLEPAVGWNYRGLILPKGAVLDSMDIIGRCNSSEVVDLQVRVVTIGDKRDSIGFDSLLESKAETIFSSDTISPTVPNLADKGKISLDLGQQIMDDTREVLIFMRPVGLLKATRYGYYDIIINYSLKS